MKIFIMLLDARKTNGMSEQVDSNEDSFYGCIIFYTPCIGNPSDKEDNNASNKG
jgi:hypothetical protein